MSDIFKMIPKGIDIPDMQIPTWLGPAAENLVRSAEGIFGPKRGPEKKAWVKQALREALRKHDIKAIPDWVETPIENAIVGLVVDIAWAIGDGQYKA